MKYARIHHMSVEGQPRAAPAQSAFFRATEAARYQRQEEIRAYENATGRSLIVFWGPIHPPVITPCRRSLKIPGFDHRKCPPWGWWFRLVGLLSVGFGCVRGFWPFREGVSAYPGRTVERFIDASPVRVRCSYQGCRLVEKGGLRRSPNGPRLATQRNIHPKVRSPGSEWKMYFSNLS